jgi:hypothetical protein
VLRLYRVRAYMAASAIPLWRINCYTSKQVGAVAAEKNSISFGVLAFYFPFICLIIPLLSLCLSIFYGVNLPYRSRRLLVEWAFSSNIVRFCSKYLCEIKLAIQDVSRLGTM